MSKSLVLSVFDSKVQLYAQPFFMRTRGEALRGWIDVVNDSSTQISKYPLDFSLCEIAEYDESTGQFTNLPAINNLGTAASYKHAHVNASGDRQHLQSIVDADNAAFHKDGSV